MEHEEVNIALGKLLKELTIKKCFYPDKVNCSEKIVKAHSIQESRILKRIAKNGEVMMVGPNATKPEFQLAMKPVGKARATTFTGFCGRHDKIVFQPIEDHDYDPANQEQNLLFAYRALSKEWHAKLGAFMRGQSKVSESPIMGPVVEAYAIALKDIERCAEGFKDALIGKSHDLVSTRHISFDEECLLAVSSMVTIPSDFEGKYFEHFFDFGSPATPLFITVFPEGGKTHVLLSYHAQHGTTYSFLEPQLVALGQQEQKIRLTNLITLNCENLVLSPDLWSKLADEHKAEFLKTKKANLIELEKANSYTENHGFTLFE